MFFSIIIPTCNRNQSLVLCLEKLKPGAQALGFEYYEVIISDDGKNNEAKELVEQHFSWAKWVAGPKKGPAANRNNGAKLASGNWLVFTDDDCIPDAKWLNAYVDAIEQHPVCRAFEGAILPDNWNLLKKDMAECPVNDKGGCFWSANIILEKNLFWEVGGFDERFKIAANEDQALFDLVKNRTAVLFVPFSKIKHPVRLGVLSKKLKTLGQSEFSQMLLRKAQGYSIVQNYIDGLNIHFRALVSNMLVGKIQKMIYHIAGFLYRLLPSIFVLGYRIYSKRQLPKLIIFRLMVIDLLLFLLFKN